MKRITKRIVSLMLAAVMVFCAVPLAGLVGIELPKLTTALAVDDVTEFTSHGLKYWVNLVNNSAIISGYNETIDSDLVIPSYIDGHQVQHIDSNAFSECNIIENVTIPATVKTIQECAFWKCSNLRSLTFEKNSQLTDIYYLAFDDCTSLEEINIPECIIDKIDANDFEDSAFYNDDSNWEDGVLYLGKCLLAVKKDEVASDYVVKDETISIARFSFNDCNNIEKITIPNTVTVINNAFSGCENLSEVEFAINSNLKVIGQNAFSDCKSLKNLSIPEQVSTIGWYAFNNSGIENIVIPEGLIEIQDYAFFDCDNLSNITIPDNVTEIGEGAFKNCTNLSNVDLGKGLTNISYEMFSMCISLGNISIPDNVVNIDHYAFYGCLNLKEICIGSGIQFVGYTAFEGTGFYINEDNWENGVLYIDNILYDTKPETVSGDYIIKDSTIYIEDSAFENCNKITSIKIPAKIKNIGYRTFYNCSLLNTVEIAEESVMTKIGYQAFAECQNLESINIPASVIEIGDCAFDIFYGNLTRVDIASNSKLTSIGNRAFATCAKLTYINIPASVVEIGNEAFLFCPLNDFVIEEGSKLEVIGDRTFCGCENDNFVIPSNVTKIGEEAFAGCRFKSFFVPAYVVTIGKRAFENCENLIEIIVDDSNEYYSNDENGVLFDKNKETLIYYPCGKSDNSYDIPESVLQISDGAFEGSKIKSITVPQNILKIDGIPFGGCSYLEKINVSEDNVSYSSDEYGVLFNKDKSVLISYPKRRGATENVSNVLFEKTTENGAETEIDKNLYIVPKSVSEISDRAFSNACYLKTVIFEENSSLKKIGDHAFYMTSISEINIPENANFKTIGNYAFYSCDLEKINIPSTVTEIGEFTFAYCLKLTTVSIPSGVKRIERGTFIGCVSLVNVHIAENSQLESIDYEAFSGCSVLEKIYIPAKVDYIYPTSPMWSDPFYNCTNLKSFDVSADNLNYSSDENGVLYNRDKTCVIRYPGGSKNISYSVPYGVTSIDNFSFYYAENLEEINLPKTVISMDAGALQNTAFYKNNANWEEGVLYLDHFLLKANNSTISSKYTIKEGITHIANNAFYYCSNINTVEIPDDVISIGDYAFYGSGITDFYYEGSPSEWAIIDRGSFDGISGTVHFGRSDEKNILTDNNTGISLEYYKDIYQGNVDILVTETFDGSVFDIISSEIDVSQNLIYDIKMSVDGVETQPSGRVTVKIPMPEDYTPAKTFVYHVDTNSGRVENMNAEVETINGKKYLVFETNHFSYYAVVEMNIDTDELSAVIRTPSTTTISYGDRIILHADLSETLPSGWSIKWTASNSNFDMDVSSDGTTCKISPSSKGDTTFTATVYDAQGNAVSKDEQVMTSKAGFFDKIIAFFKKLFGLTKTIPQIYKGIF